MSGNIFDGNEYMEKQKERVPIFGLMVIDMKEIWSMTKEQEKEI